MDLACFNTEHQQQSRASLNQKHVCNFANPNTTKGGTSSVLTHLQHKNKSKCKPCKTERPSQPHTAQRSAQTELKTGHKASNLNNKKKTNKKQKLSATSQNSNKEKSPLPTYARMPVCLNPTYFSDTPPKKSRKRRAAALRSNLARTAKARQPGLSARICPRSLPPRSATERTVLTGELQHYRSAGPCRRGKRARSGASSRRAARAAGGNGQSPGGTASHGAAGRPGRGQRAEQPGDKSPTFSRLGAPPVLPAVPRRASPRTPAAVRPRCSRRSAAAMLPSRPAGRFRFRQMGRRAARLRRAPPVGVEETTRLPARQHRAYRGGSVGRRLLAGRTRLCG